MRYLFLLFTIHFSLFTFYSFAQYQPTSQWFENPELLVDYVEDCADFWQGTKDDSFDGYFMEIGRSGNVLNSWADKSIVQHSRLAYGFTRAFMMTGNEAYLDNAKDAIDFMEDHLWDEEFGGWFSTCGRNGNNPNTGNKTAFDQHYALLGLTAYWEASREEGVHELLMDGYQFNEEFLWDDDNINFGYYHEAIRSGYVAYNKSFNATVDAVTTHVYNLYLLTGEQQYLDRLNALKSNMLDYMVGNMPDQAIGFPEHFNTDWEINTSETRSLMGHVLKTGWCLARVYRVEADQEALDGAEALIDDVLAKGYDHQYGGPYKDFNRVTGQMHMYGAIDTAKAWWQMEQAITGGFLMWEITGEDKYIRMADESLEFFMSEFVDPVYGEIYADRARDGGRVHYNGGYWDENKAGLWKSAYHSIETGYYAYVYGKLLIKNEPVTLYYKFNPTGNETVRMNPLAIDFTRLKIASVTLNGNPFTNFDANHRLLNLTASDDGLFAVTYEMEEGSSILERNAITLNSIYPNPVSSHATISITTDAVVSFECLVLSQLGTVVREFPIDMVGPGKHEFELDLSGLSRGVYFIKLVANGPDNLYLHQKIIIL